MIILSTCKHTHSQKKIMTKSASDIYSWMPINITPHKYLKFKPSLLFLRNTRVPNGNTTWIYTFSTPRNGNFCANFGHRTANFLPSFSPLWQMAFMKRPSLRSSFPRHKTGLILFGFLIHSNLLSALDPFVSRHVIY